MIDVTAGTLLANATTELGHELPMWTVAPFAILLGCIALFPLVAPHWWEHNRNKGWVALALGAPIAIYLLAAFGTEGGHALLEKLHEYVAFIVLLAALFVISGGIYVQGSLSGTPLVNTGLLAFGAVIASFVGTTGASMLLIRPLLRANKSRQRSAHVVVFFILTVSNCGGLLTPLGDPPLFLGFLNGVPFDWTLSLWKEWLVVNIGILVIFNIWDQAVLAREERERPGSQLEAVMEHQPLRVRGLLNLVFLGGIVATVYAAGKGIGFDSEPWPIGLQEGIMVALTAAAFATTPSQTRTDNRFSWGPIIEVAVLFAGIFVTMTPALLLLNAHGAKLGLSEPWEFFWATGMLSSVLDNAPTYLTFAATACGQAGVPLEPRYLATYLDLPVAANSAQILAAISCGAVFMGANTYIGNGPNFMVKAIAEESGVKMPGFFGYMFYPAVVLLPLFVLVTFLFFAP
jgi:Na+/H+ antiporter NhaD/arsenite permease-like protein